MDSQEQIVEVPVSETDTVKPDYGFEGVTISEDVREADNVIEEAQPVGTQTKVAGAYSALAALFAIIAMRALFSSSVYHPEDVTLLSNGLQAVFNVILVPLKRFITGEPDADLAAEMGNAAVYSAISGMLSLVVVRIFFSDGAYRPEDITQISVGISSAFNLLLVPVKKFLDRLSQ